MDSLANSSTEMINDGSVDFREMFSADYYSKHPGFFKNFEKWQLTNLKTTKLIIDTMQQDPLIVASLEDAARYVHSDLRIEYKKRKIRILQLKEASTSQEVKISEVCFD